MTDFAEDWIREWSASASERAARTQELSDDVAALSVEALDSDGFVSVTVAASGALVGLRLDERVRNWPAEHLANEILTTMRRAQARLADRVADIAARTVGPDSETARTIVRSFATRFPIPDEPRAR